MATRESFNSVIARYTHAHTHTQDDLVFLSFPFFLLLRLVLRTLRLQYAIDGYEYEYWDSLRNRANWFVDFVAVACFVCHDKYTLSSPMISPPISTRFQIP